MERTEDFAMKTNNETMSSTAIRYEASAIALAYQSLCQCQDRQAETIARHYIAHATLALNLLHLIEARRHSSDPVNLDAAIDHCVQQIKRNHMYDFGIELEWRQLP